MKSLSFAPSMTLLMTLLALTSWMTLVMSEPVSSTNAAPSKDEWRTEAVKTVLLRGISCRVQAYHRLDEATKRAHPCVAEGAEGEEGDRSGRVKRHSGGWRWNWQPWTRWRPQRPWMGWSWDQGHSQNNQTVNCPRSNDTDVTPGLSTDPTDYPVDGILRTTLSGAPDRVDTMLETAPALQPTIPINPQAELENTTCPTVKEVLASFQSPTRNVKCWIARGFQQDVEVNLECRQSKCGCGSANNDNGRRRRWRGQQSEDDQVELELCYPTFTTYTRRVYCELNPVALVVEDIKVPTDCTCRKVKCSRQSQDNPRHDFWWTDFGWDWDFD